ncbi:MAG: sulfotransferase [Candidatus Magnetoovum sp. WYHC-5]|nr:sulfotransferase [Candidatus Magnetoovum sp. WYHC-5]
MSKRFHFISGLPRSGSTLLGAILLQNPRFLGGMTSPVGSLFQGMLAQFSAGSEFAPVVDEVKRKRLLRGIFELYYAECDVDVVFDTNRLWSSKLPAITQLFPDAKVICTVRDIVWVMDSLERLYRNNAFENTRLFDANSRSTVYTRLEALSQPNGLVGFAYTALKEAFYSEQAERLLIVEYEYLAQSPHMVMPLIYQFIGEPYYEHDFSNVQYDAPAFDAQLGVKGLHRIETEVQYKPRRSVLPPDLVQKYSDMSFWRDLAGSRAHLITAQPDQ